MDGVEQAQESLEAAERREHAEVGWNRHAAIVIAVLAAIAVVVEMSANDAQTAYLSHHVSVSDIWAEYQGKSTRRVVLTEAADILASSAGSNPDQTTRNRIENTRAEAERMLSDPAKGNGMEQLAQQAKAETEQRDHARERYEGLERAARGLQIGVVVTGLAIVTRALWLFALGGVLGAAAAVYGLLVGLSLS
jgi:hypothetical protein